MTEEPEPSARTSREHTARLLNSAADSEPDAIAQLAALLYDELRCLAKKLLARERPNHTLDSTAIVNEAYARLVGGTPVELQGKAHFKALAARTMRRILIDHSRKRPPRHVTLSSIAIPDQAFDAVEIGELLDKLRKVHERQAAVVELRFFGGLTWQEIATFLGVTARTATTDWLVAKVWLMSKLRDSRS